MTELIAPALTLNLSEASISHAGPIFSGMTLFLGASILFYDCELSLFFLAASMSAPLPTNLSLKLTSSTLSLGLTTPVTWPPPSLILSCKLLSIGSSMGFAGTTGSVSAASAAALPMFVGSLLGFCRGGILPFSLRLKKNLPCFESLFGTTAATAPAFILMASDTLMGSSF